MPTHCCMLSASCAPPPRGRGGTTLLPTTTYLFLRTRLQTRPPQHPPPRRCWLYTPHCYYDCSTPEQSTLTAVCTPASGSGQSLICSASICAATAAVGGSRGLGRLCCRGALRASWLMCAANSDASWSPPSVEDGCVGRWCVCVCVCIVGAETTRGRDREGGRECVVRAGVMEGAWCVHFNCIVQDRALCGSVAKNKITNSTTLGNMLGICR